MEEAQKRGIQVISVRYRGKGNVVQQIFRRIESPYLLMVDGDDTYAAQDAVRLVAPLFEGVADMVVGNRFSHETKRGFSWSHRVGNVLFRFLLNSLFGTRYADILSGYRAMTYEFYRNIPLLSREFEVETELTLQALERGYTIEEVRVSYQDRPANSHSKIREFRDGSRIIMTIVSLLRDYRPMIFFSIIGSLFLVFGLSAGTIIVIEYIRTGAITRVPTAILTVLLVLLGINSFMSGLILSAVNRRYREMETILKRLNSHSH
jgi:hypothetical protein